MNEMSDEELQAFSEAQLPTLHNQMELVLDFLSAVAATCPEPEKVLAKFRQYRAETHGDEIDFNELTPANQRARSHTQIHEEMLVRLLERRNPPAAGL